MTARSWLLAAAALALASYSAAFTFGVLNDSRNPAMALAAHDGLPVASIRLNDLRLARIGEASRPRTGTVARGAIPPSVISGIGVQISDSERNAVEALARDALSATPLASGALRQLAYVEPDITEKARLLSLAERVSKRDLLANLQLAELALRREEIDTGLNALVRSLVVSRDVDALVFPILLGTAAVDASAERRIGTLLRSDPNWSERLVSWSLSQPQNLPNYARVAKYLPNDSLAKAPGFGQQVIDALVAQGQYEAAFDTYRAYARAPFDLTALTGAAYPPLDWKLIDNLETGSRFFEDDTIEIFGNPNREGIVAQVITRLSPGVTQLPLQVSQTIGEGAMLTLKTICLGTAGERTISEQTAPLGDGVLLYRIAVPATDCRFQRLDLEIAADTTEVSALVSARQRRPAASAGGSR